MSTRKQKSLLRKVLKGIAIGFLIFIILAFLNATLLFDALIVLCNGWWSHLVRVIPKLTINWELVFCFILSLVLGTTLLYRFLVWLNKNGTIKHSWSVKQTCIATLLMLMLFGMSVAMTGIVHQSIWVMKGPVFENRSRASETTSQIAKLKNIHTACFSHAKDHQGNYPARLEEVLEANILQDPSELFSYTSRSSHKKIGEPWVYYPSFTTSSPPNLMFLHSSTPNRYGHWIVGRIDGSVTAEDEMTFYEEIKKTHEYLKMKSEESDSAEPTE